MFTQVHSMSEAFCSLYTVGNVFVTAAPVSASSPACFCLFVYVSFSDADISHLSTVHPNFVFPDAWLASQLVLLSSASQMPIKC